MYNQILCYGVKDYNNKAQITNGPTRFLLELIGDLRTFNVHIKQIFNNFTEVKLSDGNDNENDPFFLREVYIDETEWSFKIRFQYQFLFPETYQVTKGRRENLIMAAFLIEFQKQNPQIYLQQEDDMILAVFLYQLCPRRVLDDMPSNEINLIAEEIKGLLNTRENQLKTIHSQIQQRLNISWEQIQPQMKEIWDSIQNEKEYDIEIVKEIARARLIDIIVFNKQENRISFLFRGSVESLLRCTYHSDELYTVIDEQQLQNKYAAILLEHIGSQDNQFEKGGIYDVKRISQEYKLSFTTKLDFISTVCKILNSMTLEQQNQVLFWDESQVQFIWSFYRKVKTQNEEEKHQIYPVFVLIEKNLCKPISLILLLKRLIVEAVFDDEAQLNLKLVDNLFGDYMRYLVQIDEKFFPKFSSIVKRIDCIKQIIGEVYLLQY